jgi:hypothetical protein
MFIRDEHSVSRFSARAANPSQAESESRLARFSRGNQARHLRLVFYSQINSQPSTQNKMIRYELRYCVKAMNQIERSIFFRWKSIKDRCLNPSNATYADYGGRGIKICDQWVNNFMQFVADVGLPESPELELDRTNNNGNYEPGNVRWVTRTTNMRNVRSNKPITIDGVSKLASQWADESGISRPTMSVRIKLGWTGRDLLAKPSERIRSERIVLNGITKTAAEWAKEIGISVPGLKRRMEHGLPYEEIIKPSQKVSQHTITRTISP